MSLLELLGLLFIVVIGFNFLVGVWAVITATHSKKDVKLTSDTLV